MIVYHTGRMMVDSHLYQLMAARLTVSKTLLEHGYAPPLLTIHHYMSYLLAFSEYYITISHPHAFAVTP